MHDGKADAIRQWLLQDPVVIGLLLVSLLLPPSWGEGLVWVGIAYVLLISAGGLLTQILVTTMIIAIDAQRHGRPVWPPQQKFRHDRLWSYLEPDGLELLHGISGVAACLALFWSGCTITALVYAAVHLGMELIKRRNRALCHALGLAEMLRAAAAGRRKA